MQTDIAIVGGGLAGLALAYELEQRQFDYTLFEARERFGGRILKHTVSDAIFDMGPSWFWQGQPRIANLIEQLGLGVFEQYAKGQNLFENEQGHVVRNVGFSSMQGSLRIRGGTAALTEALSARLPAHKLHNNYRLVEVNEQGTLHFTNGEQCSAKRIILTMPPRVVSELNFTPELNESALQAMRAIPTWMAGHAKFYAAFASPFWREQGLSGDVFSRRGPLVEIHDACADDTQSGGALFGFLGVPAAQRTGNDKRIVDACIAQLARIFGEQAANPTAVQYKDWSVDSATATALDSQGLSHHPHYTMPEVLRELWAGRLLLCGTETAPEFGGYMEGALCAATHTANVISQSTL